MSWSEDGKSFSINDKKVILFEFTQLHKEVVDAVAVRTALLMLGWTLVVNLSKVKDDLTCNITGWSFMQAKDNGLQLAYKQLLQKAWDLSAGMAANGCWKMAPCMKYLDECTILCGEIFAAVHITAGLPPCGSKGIIVKVQNTAQVLRNIFIVNGCMALIFKYNKSHAANNHSFFIVRFLTPKLGQLVFCYLAYIRPFANFLCKQVGIPQYRSNEFLFPDPKRKQKHMSSVQATAILRHFIL